MGYEQIFPLFPELRWEMEKCPVPKSFFEEAHIWIPEDHVEPLETVMSGELSEINLHECPVIADVAEFYNQMTQELHLLREGKGGTTIVPSGFLKENNPLEREEKLLRLKWDFLQMQKTPEEDWGLRAVFIYMLQLRILVRRSSFIQEEGEKRFKALCQVIEHDEHDAEETA